MLAATPLPTKSNLLHKTCTSCIARRRTDRRKRWRCDAVSSESAAPELEGTRSKTTDARSNIVPHGLRRFPSRSDREDQGLAAILRKLPATNYSALLSSAGKARSPGGLNTVLESYSEQPEHDRIPLHGGLPHPSAFPFAQLTVKLTSGSTLTIDNPDLVGMATITFSALLLVCQATLTAVYNAGHRCSTVRNTLAGMCTSQCSQVTHNAAASRQQKNSCS